MIRVILLLCFTLASCQQAIAVWPFASGERSSSSNVDYTNTINSAISNLPSYISYITSQQAGGQQQTQPQLLSTEGESLVSGQQQLGPTTEVKPVQQTNHGIKGMTRYLNRNKVTQSQQPVQQLQDFFASQPENIFSHGYLEPVTVVNSGTGPGATQITGTVNLSDGKEKEGGFFRNILPWRWVNRSSATAPAADEASGVQASAPKRSWPTLFSKQPSRTNSVGQQATPYCPCFSSFQPLQVYQSAQPYASGQQQQQSQQSQHQQHQPQYLDVTSSDGTTNVRQVEPSSDFIGEGSNPIPNVVPAPSQVLDVHQQQQNQQQQVQQSQVVSNGGTADSLANHHQQQQQQQSQQQQQFVQQFQSVPVVTNFHQPQPPQQPAETGNQQQSSPSGQVVVGN